MPGPGGGSSGGGFGGGSFGGGGGFSGSGGFGGGSFGGGNHGGSFGGGHHHTPPHHHGPHFHGTHFGWGWGRRRYVGGGGCVTGLLVALFIMFFAINVFVPEGDLFDDPFEVTHTYETEFYDEGIMQDYANENYKKYFGDYDNYENNILLVFLTNEACDGYYTIAWVGDNINYEINEMFGEYTEYGQALTNFINQDYYAYSLDTDLTAVIKEMTRSITDFGLETPFNSEFADYEKPYSKLDNNTALEMNTELVDAALADFTAQTGIPCVIVVDSAEKVFGYVESSVTATEVISVPPASVEDEVTLTHDNEAETEIIEVQPTYTVIDDSAHIAIIGGADGPTQISVGSNVSVVIVIALIIIVAVTVAFFLRLRKSKGFTAEKGKNSKEEKPPWEL